MTRLLFLLFKVFLVASSTFASTGEVQSKSYFKAMVEARLWMQTAKESLEYEYQVAAKMVKKIIKFNVLLQKCSSSWISWASFCARSAQICHGFSFTNRGDCESWTTTSQFFSRADLTSDRTFIYFEVKSPFKKFFVQSLRRQFLLTRVFGAETWNQNHKWMQSSNRKQWKHLKCKQEESQYR